MLGLQVAGIEGSHPDRVTYAERVAGFDHESAPTATVFKFFDAWAFVELELNLVHVQDVSCDLVDRFVGAFSSTVLELLSDEV